ncbi:methyl-accepting chemotaxis protein [Picosynechococcus sp. NKBG15041c]|uniref:methyl-accepting chemotaxis protein n=1 Tax=Picosynechococcus sp. NKBG15041c TaxID=1407650 RepID=UPI0003F73AC1|nr:methyl-accepting chemotaxis protein [Picosynechococcus sp. NKBG15041c]
MTIAENFPNDASLRFEDTSLASEGPAAKKTESTKGFFGNNGPGGSSAKKQRKAGPLSRRLLVTVMPTVLTPLILASAIGYKVVSDKAKADVINLLQEDSFLASEATANFVNDLMKVPGLLAVDPQINQALRGSEAVVAEQKLTQLPQDRLEAQFSTTRFLQPNTNLNNYLKNISAQSGIQSLLVTNRYGFNVASDTQPDSFVHSAEDWWQGAQANGVAVEEAVLDEATGEKRLGIARSVLAPGTEEFLGVVEVKVSSATLHDRVRDFVEKDLYKSQRIQLIDPGAGTVLDTIQPTDSGLSEAELTAELDSVIGGENILQMARDMNAAVEDGSQSDEAIKTALENKYPEIHRVEVESFESATGKFIEVTFELGDKDFSISTIPNVPWVAIASMNAEEINTAGRDLLKVFSATGLVLGGAAVGILILLARQLSKPLASLSITAEQVAAGNLDVVAEEQGTIETLTLGYSFNNLLTKVNQLIKEQKIIAEEQQQRREELESEVESLMSNIEGAVDGDLTVRAQLMAGEVGIVADLFNAVIENLHDIAKEVKKSSGQVTGSLTENEAAIRSLAEEAIHEALEVQKSLDSVKSMSQSIEEVAKNAIQASAISNTAFTTVQAGNQVMNQTVESIQGLRATIGDTAKKMKRLGESAQKISQVVALIDELALKTNLLSINASVEAARAGELGQGFTAVAEQVGALAEQSAAATKEISKIVTSIQSETQELVAAMETGTAQVVDSTNLVETTKERLAEVLERSQEIDQLMQSISASTTAQAETAQGVTKVMNQMAFASELRSSSSREVAEAMHSTAEVAQKLKASVEQFKV